MCQMTIHAHAQTTTMLQAMEHNLRTTLADLDTLVPILRVRGADDATEAVGLTDLESVAYWVKRAADVLHGRFEVALAEHPHVDGCEHPDHGPNGATGVTVAAREHFPV